MKFFVRVNLLTRKDESEQMSTAIGLFASIFTKRNTSPKSTSSVALAFRESEKTERGSDIAKSKTNSES